jgi:hypothetical protein
VREFGHLWVGAAVSSERGGDGDYAALSEAFGTLHRPGGVLVCNRHELTRRLAAEHRPAGVMHAASGGELARWCDVLLAAPSPDRAGGVEVAVACAEALGKEIILV